MKTFITELNHQQVDVIGDDVPESCIYYNIRIYWGLDLVENQRELDLLPFVDRIIVWSGEDARQSNKMLIIKNDFMDILNDENSEYEIKYTFLRDDPTSNQLISIVPKFIGIDIKDKIVEVLFNA